MTGRAAGTYTSTDTHKDAGNDKYHPLCLHLDRQRSPEQPVDYSTKNQTRYERDPPRDVFGRLEDERTAKDSGDACYPSDKEQQQYAGEPDQRATRQPPNDVRFCHYCPLIGCKNSSLRIQRRLGLGPTLHSDISPMYVFWCNADVK